MSSSEGPPSFCLFCYKSISSSAKLKDNSYGIKDFSTFLSRFVCGESESNQHIINTNYSYGLLNSCDDCDIIINSFCQLYNQLKCLELQLDLKLDKIVKKIELSNKIPGRWINVQNALQLTFQGDIEKIIESRKEIIHIRQDVIKSGQERLEKCRPLVSLERLHQTVIDNIVNRQSINEDQSEHPPVVPDNIEDDNWDNGASTSSVEYYPQIAIKQEFPQGLFSENDPAIPEVPTFPSPPKAKKSRNVVPCEICGKGVAELLMNKHYRMSHDLSKVAHEYQIFRCDVKECKAYFLSKRQLKMHTSEIHDVSKKKICDVPPPAPEYLDGVEYFRCDVCKTPFDFLPNYKRHLKSSNCGEMDIDRNDGKTLGCPDCREIFKRKNDLWVHRYEVHSTDKGMVCPKCGKFFRQKRRLKLHMEYHKGPSEWKWECKACGKRTATNYEIKRHVSTHKKDHKDWMEEELIIEHGIIENGNIKMEQDGTLEDQVENEVEEPWGQSDEKEVSIESSLITVAAATLKNCICTYCGKGFSKEYYLKRHMLHAHKTAKGMYWRCGKCGKKFANRANMTSHLKLHKAGTMSKSTNSVQIGHIGSSGRISNLSKDPLEINITKEDSPVKIEPETLAIPNADTDQLQCLECNELFEIDKELWIHRRDVHLKNVCHICGKQYAQKTGYNVHLEYHKDPLDWNWECKECGKKCATKQKLMEHLRTHAGIKPYSCHLCEKRCALPASLRRHLEEQHGLIVEPKPRIRKENSKVSCSYCHMELAHRGSLKRHIRLVHKDKSGDIFQTSDNNPDSVNLLNEDSLEGPMEILP